MSNKQVFQSVDYNGQILTDISAIQLTSNATLADHAVRLSQVEQVSADAVQAALVSAPNEASTSTVFTSATMQSFLTSLS